ncbi:TPA: hypothetical protein ACJXY4_005635 [Pseudomonas aeruginosa]
MQYTNIVPAQDWFFCHDAPTPGQPEIIYPVAVWASYEKNAEDGNGTDTVVVGLIAPDFGNDGSRRLHTPPPVKGRYVHRSELSENDLARLIRK